MSVRNVVEAVTALAVIAAAAFEARQLVRHPRDPALRALAPGLVLLAVTLSAGVPVWPLTVLQEFQDRTYLGDVIWMTMAWCYAAFFLFAARARDARLRRRLAGLTFLALLICVAVHLVTRFTAPAGTWHIPRQPGDYRTWRNVAFYVAMYGYSLVLYALGTAWAGTYLRRLTTHRWLRAAVITVIVGAGAMTLGVDVITLAQELVLGVLLGRGQYPWSVDLYDVGRLGGQLLLAAGLLLAPVAALAFRVRQRRDQAGQAGYSRALEALWQRLTREFPFVVLRSDRLAGSFGRRTAEISDGLTRSAPYVPVEHRFPGTQPTLTQSADMVEAALEARERARHEGEVEDAWNEGPNPVIEPDFGGHWRRRARWMRDLATELERRDVLASVSQEPAG